MNPLSQRPAVKHGESRGWPAYLLGGRIRTSTIGLIVVFFVAYWLHQTYTPPPPPPAPAVVPPGFVPDPEYTWVPRTNVQIPTSTDRPTPTTDTTESTETTETTTSSETPTTTSGPVTTTVINPAPGILPPITLPVLLPPAPASPPPPSPVTPPPGPVTTTVISPGALPTSGESH